MSKVILLFVVITLPLTLIAANSQQERTVGRAEVQSTKPDDQKQTSQQLITSNTPEPDTRDLPNTDVAAKASSDLNSPYDNINIFSGDLRLHATDLDVPVAGGKLRLQLTRSYRSGIYPLYPFKSSRWHHNQVDQFWQFHPGYIYRVSHAFRHAEDKDYKCTAIKQGFSNFSTA